MSYLLDAHVLIWHRSGDTRLPVGVRSLLSSDTALLYISDAVLWELTIKHALGKLTLVGGVESLYQEWIGSEVARSLGIEWNHIRRVGQLPQLHRDPFDRLLVSQSMHEGLTVITGDPQIQQYPGIKFFWS